MPDEKPQAGVWVPAKNDADQVAAGFHPWTRVVYNAAGEVVSWTTADYPTREVAQIACDRRNLEE